MLNTIFKNSRVRKRFVAGLASLAAVVLLGAGSAQAGSVAFSTTGTFGSDNASSVNFGSDTLTFSGVSQVVDSGTNAAATLILNAIGGFGSFALSNPAAAGISDTFTLNLTETFPDSNSGSLLGSVSGSVTSVNGSIQITFTSQTITIPTTPIIYKIDQDTFVGPGNNPAVLGGTVTIPAGAPTLTPLPKSALGSCGLLAILAAAGAIGRRRQLTV